MISLPWTAELPSSWNIVPARAMLKSVRREPRSMDMTVTAFRDGQVTLRSNRRIDGFTESVKDIGYQGVRQGEVVIHSMDAFAGAIGVSDSDGKMSPVVHIYTAPSDSPEFLVYSLRVASRAGFIRALAKGIRERSTSFDRPVLKTMLLPRPPRKDQDAIVEYLDRETQKIDELITEQRGLIETLRERRRAAISAAIQPHDLQGWGRLPLRYAIQFQEGPGIGAADFRESGVPLLRISSIRGAVATLEGVNYLDPKTVDSRWSHFKVETGDLLINSSASMGSVAEVLDDEVVGSIPYTGIIRVRAGLMVKEFARWYFESDAFMHQIELLKTGSTIQHYGPMHLRQVRVSLPEQHRQLEIARDLDGQTSRIDELISESEDLIALSQERRTALITAAVTGQIDVRTAT